MRLWVADTHQPWICLSVIPAAEVAVASQGVTAISGLHPAQALLAAVQAVLDSPEGAASFRAVFEELSEGEGSLRADRLGELASRLLPGAAPWEQQLFQSVVSLCRVEMLNAQHLEAEVRAATASLEDASSADQEMATLAGEDIPGQMPSTAGGGSSKWLTRPLLPSCCFSDPSL